MKLVMNIADYVKEQVDAGKAEELGIPPWLAYEIAIGIPFVKQESKVSEYDKDHIWYKGDQYISLRRFLEAKSEEKTGHWIRWYEQKEHDRCTEYIPHCKCSECGKEYDSYSSKFIKYCSECGARMMEEKNDHNKV